MKSNKQRRAEIKQLRLARAARIEAQLRGAPRDRHVRVAGMVPADGQVLAFITSYHHFCCFAVQTSSAPQSAQRNALSR